MYDCLSLEDEEEISISRLMINFVRFADVIILASKNKALQKIIMKFEVGMK